ncbi:DUF3048 domain-containing protein [Patescibacteria group bacterium]|nr:DUF3048 domain-containing protein [Patescibacteria group bacterium]
MKETKKKKEEKNIDKKPPEENKEKSEKIITEKKTDKSEKKEELLKKPNSEKKKNLFAEKPALVIGGVLVLGAIISWIFIGIMSGQILGIFNFGKSDSSIIETDNSEDISLTRARLLDGRIVAKENSSLLPVGIMIENLPSVRPQSGLSKAQIVYEALVEGFSTRFLVIFDPNELPDRIGPVRSARPYYLEWISEYDGLYVHAGGSPEALAAVDGLGLKDLNALHKGQYFWRDSSLSAPHNLFTSKELLGYAVRDLGFEDSVAEFDLGIYSSDPDLADRPEDAKKVIIRFSGNNYEVEYQYDRDSDEYLRFNGGVEHKDSNNDQQIRAKNVIVVEIPPVVSIGEKGRLTFDISGEGRALVARHGEIIEGTWEKPDRTSKTRYYDLNGEEIDLGRGSTWVHIIPETQEYTYE